MQNYKYVLQYINNDSILTKEFSADINIDELKMELMLFLRGCSWTDKQTAFLEEDPEEPFKGSIEKFIKNARREGLNSDEILEKLERGYYDCH